MKSLENNPDCACPRDDIAAYTDGELAPSEELDLERHFSSCSICLSEFNSQKELLSVLDSAMEIQDRDLPLPRNFSRVVTVNAESNVAGIRSPVERYRALSVCAVLFLIASISLGADAGMAFEPVEKFAVQSFAVAGFVFHFLFDIGIGLGVVLRCFGQGIFQDSSFALVMSVAVFLVAGATLSKTIGRYNRTP